MSSILGSVAMSGSRGCWPGLGRLGAHLAVLLSVSVATPRFTAGQGTTRIEVSVRAAKSQAPLPATVVLTIAPTTESLVVQADPSGTASVTLVGPQRTGEYIVSASAIGYRTSRQRVTVPGADTVFSVRFALASDTAQMATVRVQATVPRAQRTFGVDPSVADGQNRRPDGVLNVVDPSQQGTLEALAASLPGLVKSEGSVAAFGLGAAGTTVTLNGMQQGLTTIPRDISVSTTVLTSPWDATRGAFSGALVSHTIQSGTNIQRRRTRVALDGSATEVGQHRLSPADRLAHSAALSVGGSGTWLLGRGFYNYGLQFTQRTYQTAALSDASFSELARIGLSADAVRTASAALLSRGVPQAVGLTVGGREARQLTFLQRLDLNGSAKSGTGPPANLSLLYGGGAGDVGGIGSTVANTASTAATFSSRSAFAQLSLSANTGARDQVAHQTTVGVHIQGERVSADERLPSGILRTTSVLDASRQVTSQIHFGGSALAPERNQHRSVDLVHQTSWLMRGLPSLPTKVMAQLRLDDGWADASAASPGQFEYVSADAFRDGSAASYTRTLAGSRVRSRIITSSVATSTAWETRRLSVVGGARIDAAQEVGGRSTTVGAPSASGALRTLGISPRVGFTYYPKAQRGPALYSNALSSSYRTGPHFRGGIGVFRSTPRFAEVLRNSGGRGQGQQVTGLRCVGDAAPSDGWGSNDPDNAPTACASNSGSLAEYWSLRRLLGQDYQPSKAIRSSIGWTSTFSGNYLAVDVTSSDNRQLGGTVDLQYPTDPLFQLANEGGRPVYVDAISIDPQSGRIARAPNAADQITSSERLIDARLRGRVYSASFFLIPRLPLAFGQYSVAYVGSQARRQYRGSDGAAAGSATAQEWADDAYTPQHALVVQGTRLFRRGDVGVSFSSRIASGERFSPLIDGDVNGDGLTGDRAFLPRPSSGEDIALRDGLARLARNSPASVRRCLERSIGTIAARNSCTGPWTVSSHLALVVSRWPGLSQRAQVTLNLSNPLSLLMPTGNGQSRIVAGGASAVDQTLLRVDGFRRDASRFTYQVNENFGRLLGATATRDPLRLTIDVRIDLAPSADFQRLKLNLRAAGRDGKLSADSIKARYRENVFEGLYTSLMRLGDSLALSRAQLEAFQERDLVVRSRIDSIYGALATYLISPSVQQDLRSAAKQAASADDAAWVVIYDEAPALKRILSEGQIRRLPSSARSMVTVKGFRGRFFF